MSPCVKRAFSCLFKRTVHFSFFRMNVQINIQSSGEYQLFWGILDCCVILGATQSFGNATNWKSSSYSHGDHFLLSFFLRIVNTPWHRTHPWLRCIGFAYRTANIIFMEAFSPIYNPLCLKPPNFEMQCRILMFIVRPSVMRLWPTQIYAIHKSVIPFPSGESNSLN